MIFRKKLGRIDPNRSASAIAELAAHMNYMQQALEDRNRELEKEIQQLKKGGDSNASV